MINELTIPSEETKQETPTIKNIESTSGIKSVDLSAEELEQEKQKLISSLTYLFQQKAINDIRNEEDIEEVEIIKILSQSLEIDYSDPKVAEEEVKNLIKLQCAQDAQERIDNHFPSIEKAKPKKVELVSQEESTTKLTLVDIGYATEDAEKEEQEILKYTLETLEEYKEKFKLEEMPTNLQITRYFDSKSVSRKTGRHRSELSNILQSPAYVTDKRKSLVLFPDLIETPDKELNIDQKSQRKNIRHELSHIVDPFIDDATRPMKEGFATMCENKFSLEECINSAWNTDKIAPCKDRKWMLEALSNNPTGISLKEAYHYTGIFFTSLCRRLTPEKFITVYGLISGGLEGNVDGVPQNFKGDIKGALNYFYRGNEAYSYDELFNMYLNDLELIELYKD